MSKDPYGQLASSLLSSFHKQTRQAIGGVGAVLGTITSTGLKLDDFKHELQEYMVAELPGQLSLPRRTVEGTISGDTGKSAVSLELEETEVEEAQWKLNQGLQPGDRVLAVRVNGGHDVVVVCKVVSGHG